MINQWWFVKRVGGLLILLTILGHIFILFFGWRGYPIGDWWWITRPGFRRTPGPTWWIFWLLQFYVCLFHSIFHQPKLPWSFWSFFWATFAASIRLPIHPPFGCPVSTPVDMVVSPAIYRVSYMLGGCLGFLPSTVSIGIPQVSHYSSIELPIDITPPNLNIYIYPK